MRAESEAALAAVRIAQTLLAADSGTPEVISKGGRDLATPMDLAVEDAIRAELVRRYPALVVVGEERGGQPESEQQPYWLVDPICGTRVYASGLPLFCINVALVEDGRTTLAVVGDGASDAIYLAERGHGAQRLSASGSSPLGVSDASQTLLVDVSSSRAGDWTPHAARFLAAALLADRWYVWSLGTSLWYAHLAAGKIAGLVHFGAGSPVHSAAGCLLAVEAGAVLSDLEGGSATRESRGWVAAATTALHRELIDLVAGSRP